MILIDFMDLTVIVDVQVVHAAARQGPLHAETSFPVQAWQLVPNFLRRDAHRRRGPGAAWRLGFFLTFLDSRFRESFLKHRLSRGLILHRQAIHVPREETCEGINGTEIIFFGDTRARQVGRKN